LATGTVAAKQSDAMTIRYIIERIDGGYRATCEEQGASATGPTVDRAVSSLRRALEDKQADPIKRGAA
jgi:hypothetical protein